ncbi:hypothetical protein glysoja_009664, partial [Glycine soja]
LIVSFCEWGGSSRGSLSIFEKGSQETPSKESRLDKGTSMVRGLGNPIKYYRLTFTPSGKMLLLVRYSSMKCREQKPGSNMHEEYGSRRLTRLRNALGRKVVKLRTRHVTKHPSVQGTWTAAVKY